MEKLTITEALSEVKLIAKKIERKKEYVLGNLVRVVHVDDPLASTGGGVETLKREIQACGDLQTRLIAIRSAIAKANIETRFSINGTERSIQEWLTWKREVATPAADFRRNIYHSAKAVLDGNAKKPSVYQDKDGDTKLVQVASNVEIPEHVVAENKIREALEKLDGLLSLKNATIVVEI